MQTSVTRRGQTVIPAAIRKRYGIVEGYRLEWLDTGEGIKVIPPPPDPLGALRGRGKGEGLLSALLDDRREDRSRER